MGEETFYIAKYWSTRGILKIQCRRAHTSTDYASCSDIGFFKIGRDAFLTLEDARKRICELRTKKIKSLQKQINKIEAINLSEIPAVEEYID